MNCTSCNSDLEQDSEIDTSIIESTECTHNFICTKESCKKRFEIEYHPIGIKELD